ncbi:MAG: GNAT family N-acetyltransferase [bacterium]
MTIKTLTNTSAQERVVAFNAAFADYFVPFRFDEAQLAAKLASDKNDLSLSVGAFDDNQLVGFMFHGYAEVEGKKRVYNGGTGVIPTHRGQGLTKQMYAYSIPLLKAKGIDQLVLEVIDKNIQALKSYEKSGFKITRKVQCYSGEITELPTNNKINIQPLTAYDWQHLQSFWGITPTWQNSAHIIDHLGENTLAFGAYLKAQLVGYLVYNPTSKRLQQIAVSPAFRQQQIGATLIAYLKENYHHTLSIINVDETSKSLASFLQYIGLKPSVAQYEMVLDLSN